MGKIGHAVDAVPTLWDDFIIAVEAHNEQRFTSNVRFTRRIREHLIEAKYKMRQENGVPFTSYELRPKLTLGSSSVTVRPELPPGFSLGGIPVPRAAGKTCDLLADRA